MREPTEAETARAASSTTRADRYIHRMLLPIPALLLALGCAGPEPAPEEEEEPEPTVEERPIQEHEINEDPAPVEPAEDAPKRYTVQEGDTLWDISEKFLRDPWLWSEIWYINPQIRDPHLIFPGDEIVLFFVDEEPHIRVERDEEVYITTLPVERLQPQVRISPLPEPIPFIPIDAIRPLLSRPQVLDADDFDDLPYLLRSEDGRLMNSAGDRIYVRNLDDDATSRQLIVRQGQAYRDPETGRLLGYQVIHVGEAELEREGDPATFRITQADREALRGDRLMVGDDRDIQRDFYPRPPEEEVDGQIIDVLEGVSLIGQYHAVAINRGSRHGIESGHVLDIYRAGDVIQDRERGRIGERVQLPDERAGLMLVFRVFDEVSYGVVMRATRDMREGDRIARPEREIRTPETREERR